MSTERVTDAIAGSEAIPTSIVTQIGKAAAKLDEITAEMTKAKDEDTARWNELREERAKHAATLDELKAAHEKAKIDAEHQALVDDLASRMSWAQGVREPSKVGVIGSGSYLAHAGKADYAAGDFAYNLWARKADELPFAERQRAEQALMDMGVQFLGLPQSSQGSLGSADASGGFAIPSVTVEKAAATFAKATLGLTAATGGQLIPGAVVSDLVKPARRRSTVSDLVDINRVNAYQTSIPVRTTSPTRAAVVAWGDTKTNVNLTYGGYTATMYTLAIIYDVSKQLLRFSRGAVEQDILEELATAFYEGRAYYILQGSGSSEPYGIQTAIATQFGAFTTSFTASSTTLAGSIAKAIASAAGDLAVRNREPEAALLGPAAYWNMVSQGTDNAGFFFAPANGPTNIRPGTLVSPFGIPVYSESQLAGSDDLLVGEFSALDVFVGETYRVDTSDTAGDRWDKNLVGFRGEEELGLDARPAVTAGAFQFIADVVP